MTHTPEDSPRPPPPEVVSARALKELEEMGEAFFSELKAVFVEDVWQLAKDLEKALEKRDAHAVDHAAHSMRGICSNFGASRLQAAGAEIAARAKAGSWADGEALLPGLREAVREVEAALGAHDHQGGATPGGQS